MNTVRTSARQRALRIVGVVALVGAILPLTLADDQPAGAIGLSQAWKFAGVRNVQYGTSASPAAYLGGYGLNMGTIFETVGFCIEHAGAAPNPAPGAYVQQSNPTVENDPILAPAVNWYQWEKLFGQAAYGAAGFATRSAGLAAVAHYRAAQLGLPGETAYPAGVGAPTGPGSFLVSDAGGTTAVLNNADVGGSAAVLIAQSAWDFWQKFAAQPGPYTTETTIVQGMGPVGQQVVARVRLAASNGADASGYFDMSEWGVSNGGTIEWSFDQGFGSILPAGTVGLNPDAGQGTVYARWTPTDNNQSTGILGQIHTIASNAIYEVPVDGSEQNMVVAGLMQALPTGATAEPAPAIAYASVAKTSTNPAYQQVAGIVFHVTDTVFGNSYGDLTVGADGNTNKVLVTPMPRTITITEDAASAAASGHVPAPPYTFELQQDQDIRVPLANAVVQTTQLELVKLDAVDQSPLAGAGFVVRRDGNNDGDYGTAAPAASVNNAGPYGPGADGAYGTADDVASSLTADGVIPGPGRDATFGTADDDGLWYSQLTPVVVGPLWAGDYQATEVTPPAGYLPPEDPTPQVSGDLAHGTTHRFTFGNKESLTIATQATKQGGNVGDPIADTAVIGGLKSGETATVNVKAYGPFDTVDDIVCTNTPVFDESFQVTGPGEKTSPAFTSTEAGIYTFVETVTTPDGRSATHECGQTEETFRIIDLTTKTASTLVRTGDALTDTAIVKGLADDETTKVTATLYGPFALGTAPIGTFDEIRSGSATATPWVCDATNTVGSVTFDVTGDGEHVSPSVVVPEPGLYTWVETLAVPGTTDFSTHACGITNETTRVVNIKTKTSAQEIGPDEKIHDVGIVTGLADDEKATIEVTLYGPYETRAAMTCSKETKVSSASYEVTGNGEFPSPEFTVTSAGIYTFVEKLVLANGDSVQHECGLDEETTRSLSITTKASATTIVEGTKIHDIGIVSGLNPDEDANIEVTLYGPYNSAADITCESAAKVATASYAIKGNGEHPSPEFTPATPGVYTFVETLVTSAGKRVAHKCGMTEETFTVTKRPVTGTGGSAGGSGSSLAWTGQNTVALVGLGIALVAIGGALVARRRRS